MSKTIKGMLVKEYQSRFQGVEDAMLISIRGVKGIATTKLRQDLRKKKIKIAVVRNSLARKAFEGTGLEGLSSMLTGPTALAFGGNSIVEVAREIVGMLKEFPGLELRGAILDGQVFEGDAGVKELSSFPTREEGIAKVVTLVVSPGRKLASAIAGPGSTLVGLIGTIESKLEKGETIAKVAG